MKELSLDEKLRIWKLDPKKRLPGSTVIRTLNPLPDAWIDKYGDPSGCEILNWREKEEKK